MTICVSLFCSTARSQSDYLCAHGALAEKIYLQSDGKVYTTDKTIWFKAIVTDALDHIPTKLSGVLYVELIAPDEKILEKKLIKLESGIGEGFFKLTPKYPEGLYQLRAYTEWNKNFGSDFFFREYIRVFAPSTKTKPEPITNITLVNNADNERRIKVVFDPLAIDSLHKKELNLYINFDERRDSFAIKKNSKNQYLFDYPVPTGCRFITMNIETKNLRTFSKTITADEDHLDLQFFPESGELVHRLPGKLGFKVLDSSGKGKNIAGEVVTGEGEVVATFKSNRLGMGSFVLTLPDSSTSYFARIPSNSPEGMPQLFPLPKVVSHGNVLSVSKIQNRILLTASSSYLKNDSITVRISCRGRIHYQLKEPMAEGTINFYFPARKLPDGIIAFTALDDSGQPLAERLWFNERNDRRITIGLSTEKENYLQREQTNVGIQTTNYKGDSINANLSLIVLNKAQLGNIQNTRSSILSYFLLSSDLKGEIEEPGYYFSRSANHFDDLDALLLTQGWRKYIYTKPVGKLPYRYESNLIVSGSVGGVFSPSKRRMADLTLLTLGANRLVLNQKTDSLGRFRFPINDEYGQNLDILIQSSNNAGKRKNYTIMLDPKISPAVEFDQIRMIEKPDSIVHQLVEKNIKRKMVDDAFPISSGDILLDEVVIQGYKMTPDRKRVMEEYGKPVRVIEGKAIQNKEQKWSYGLYSVLMFSFPDKVFIKRGNDGNLYAKVRPSEITLVVIDGIPVKEYEYQHIADIPPSEVRSFEIIENAKNFSRLFMEAFPEADPLSVPAWGDVIAIYTFGGKGIYGIKQPVGIVRTSIPVFSSPIEFYAPNYKNLKPEEWIKPDLRALIHWQPRLQTDNHGKASAAFYNADTTGEMMIVVEAISETGELGYAELDFKVEKR